MEKHNGGSFLRSGGNHDIWITADGVMIPLPRHPGDLSTSVENSIKKALGLK